MTATRSHEAERPESRKAISADIDLWIQQFIKHLELQVLDASRDLSPVPNASELQQATARAILETFLDSGLDYESVLDLLGRVAVERRSGAAVWTDELNQRRFDLIDKEIQGPLTP